MSNRWEVRLGGTGGQGLILSGIILAEGAIIDRKYVSQTQSYGPEARGGASKADLIIDTETIDFPKVLKPDIILAMSQGACVKYAPSLKPGGILIIDSTFVTNIPPIEGKVHSYPITQLAKDEIGKEITANIIALGVLTGFLSGISNESIKEAITKKVPPHTLDVNLKAFSLGLKQLENMNREILKI